MIYLIVPKIGESPAGGSIYNDFLTRSNPELKLVEVLELDSFQDQISEDAILIVDSLLLISYCDKGYHKTIQDNRSNSSPHIFGSKKYR